MPNAINNKKFLHPFLVSLQVKSAGTTFLKEKGNVLKVKTDLDIESRLAAKSGVANRSLNRAKLGIVSVPESNTIMISSPTQVAHVAVLRHQSTEQEGVMTAIETVAKLEIEHCQRIAETLHTVQPGKR